MITAKEAFETTKNVVTSMPMIFSEYLEILVKDKIKAGNYELTLYEDKEPISNNYIRKTEELIPELKDKKWIVNEKVYYWWELKLLIFNNMDVRNRIRTSLERLGYTFNISEVEGMFIIDISWLSTK